MAEGCPTRLIDLASWVGFETSHRRMMPWVQVLLLLFALLQPPRARILPLWLKARCLPDWIPVCRVDPIWVNAPGLEISHKRTSLCTQIFCLQLVEASVFPSGLKAISWILSVWPYSKTGGAGVRLGSADVAARVGDALGALEG